MILKIQKGLVGGITGTAAMSLFMMLAPLMGIPKMNPAQMLSSMMGFPIPVGWLMHFMIGVTFAMAYVFLLINLVSKIKSRILKGTICGLAIFIFAQIMMGIMGAVMGGMPPMEGNMVLMMIGSIAGHIIFGIVVALVIKEVA
ncbi:DUF6789 family protein [Ancylomarina sp. YFZ004]